MYDTLGINLLYSIHNEDNSWISSNERYSQFHNELPSPSEFYFLLVNQCRASQDCNIKIAGENNESKINLILKNFNTLSSSFSLLKLIGAS